MLKKTQGSADVDASRILGKGPEFLRRQIEGNKGRASAVERLAASKPQYVKSQQVSSSPQESEISLGSASVSSNGKGTFKKATDAADGQAHQGEEDNVVRRISSKKRDSVMLYRQKCELLRGSPVGSRRLFKKTLFSLKDKTSEISDKGLDTVSVRKESALGTPVKESLLLTSQDLNGSAAKVDRQSRTGDPPTAPPHPRVAEARELERKSRRGGVARSSSDISSRYSKHFADFDAFFRYCGLEGDVIASLGRDNFSEDLSCKGRSDSVATSDDGRSSGGHSDGLQLLDTVRQGSSVVERNARVIKWLYSCRNATESGKTLRDLD